MPHSTADALQAIESGTGLAGHVDAPHLDEVPGFPWEYVLLAGSALGAALGALAFGVPSLLITLVSMVYLGRRKTQRHRMVLVLAAMLGLAGCVAGIALSDYRWLHGRHLKWILR